MFDESVGVRVLAFDCLSDSRGVNYQRRVIRVSWYVRVHFVTEVPLEVFEVIELHTAEIAFCDGDVFSTFQVVTETCRPRRRSKRCFIFSSKLCELFNFKGAIERFFVLELEDTEEKELLPLFDEANVSNCATLLCRTKNLSPVFNPSGINTRTSVSSESVIRRR